MTFLKTFQTCLECCQVNINLLFKNKEATMQFTITRENLLKALQMVMGAVEKRQIMPILGNALLKVNNDKLDDII